MHLLYVYIKYPQKKIKPRKISMFTDFIQHFSFELFSVSSSTSKHYTGLWNQQPATFGKSCFSFDRLNGLHFSASGSATSPGKPENWALKVRGVQSNVRKLIKTAVAVWENFGTVTRSTSWPRDPEDKWNHKPD